MKATPPKRNKNTKKSKASAFHPVPGSHYSEVPEIAKITHLPNPVTDTLGSLSDEEKIGIIALHFREILTTLGLDLTDESLSQSPFRIAKMYVKEIFAGLQPKNFPEISLIPQQDYKSHSSNMVFVTVSFMSFCEHHFVPMKGIAYVAYKPRGKLIGLSKIPRIVRYFARRPQLQERLTSQIADSLSILLNTEDVAVSITASHYCVIARGVHDQYSNTITSTLRGEFDSNANFRREFFDSISRSTGKQEG